MSLRTCLRSLGGGTAAVSTLLLLAVPGCFEDPGLEGSTEMMDTTEGESSDGTDDSGTEGESDSDTDGDTASESDDSATEDTDSTGGGTDSMGDDECTWIRYGENADDDVKAVTADTWVDEETPTQNNGSDDDLRADGTSNAGMTEVSFIRFDVHSMPAGTVTDAILYLSTNDDDGSESSPGSQFSLYEIGEPWVEAEATWFEASAGVPWSVPGCGDDPCRDPAELVFFEPTEQNHTYELALEPAIAEAWRDEPETNYGLLLATPAANGGMFHSSEGKDDTMRPALEVRVCP